MEPYDPHQDFYWVVIKEPRPFDKTIISNFQMSDSEDDELFKTFSIIQPDSSDYDSE
jgi:hypothetical protein